MRIKIPEKDFLKFSLEDQRSVFEGMVLDCAKSPYVESLHRLSGSPMDLIGVEVKGTFRVLRRLVDIWEESEYYGPEIKNSIVFGREIGMTAALQYDTGHHGKLSQLIHIYPKIMAYSPYMELVSTTRYLKFERFSNFEIETNILQTIYN